MCKCNIHMFVATIRARKASTPLDAPRPLPRPRMKQPPSPRRATPAAHIGHVSHPHDRAGTVPRDCRPARHATIDLASHPRRPRMIPTKTTRIRRATTSEKRSPEEGVHGDRRLHTTSERSPKEGARRSTPPPPHRRAPHHNVTLVRSLPGMRSFSRSRSPVLA